MLAILKNRLARIEKSKGLGEVRFTLGDGVHASMRRRELLTALGEAVDGVDTLRARIMLNATSASDGNRLFELAQAIHAGPAMKHHTEETIQ